ncbi:MAG: PLP-dependent transferase [Myxococcales bacterium]|nr:PLP-dependent transferase [Myxococcales bacterium]
MPRVETLAVHAGRFPTIQNSPTSPPLFQAAAYTFSDLGEVEAIYAGTRPGAVYGRYGGPNGERFARATAALEGAEEAVGAASGMAAINAVLTILTSPADPIVHAEALYGGTAALLENDFQQRGNRLVAFDPTDPTTLAEALQRHRAPVVYVEALSNPLMRVADLPGLADVAHAHDALLAVDATFASSALLRPLALGADIVVHSVGKYLGGHGDVGAGVVAGRRAHIGPMREYLVRVGATIPHFEAWLALRGLRTLALRMERISANANAVAAFLAAADGVVNVHHPSRPEHPEHALARRLYPRGTGGIVAFDLAGGRAAVDAFLRGLETVAIVHSLGDVATTISYSAASSHRSLGQARREMLGIGEGTLRLSCGIEDVRDLLGDLARALAGVPAPVPASGPSV